MSKYKSCSKEGNMISLTEAQKNLRELKDQSTCLECTGPWF